MSPERGGIDSGMPRLDRRMLERMAVGAPMPARVRTKHAVGHRVGGLRRRAGLRDRETDALVLGANLPTSDLARFIREVRGNPAVGGIPIVVIDANDMNLRVEMLTSGADVCFPSEISFREFKATLDALLRRREESAPLGA